MSAPRGSFRRLLCAVLLTQSNLVIDEKFTSEDEEKDDTCADLRKIIADVELSRYFACAHFEENDKEGNKNHHKRVKLCKPCNDNCHIAASARRVR